MTDGGSRPQEPLQWEQPGTERDPRRRPWLVKMLLVVAAVLLAAGMGLGWFVRGLASSPAMPDSTDTTPDHTVAPTTASPTGTARQPAPATIQVTWPASDNPVAGDEVQLGGETSANLAGGTVRLQVRDSRTWNTLGSAPVSPDARFVIAVTLLKAGSGQEFRIHAPATAATAEAASEIKKLDIYGWYDLGAMGWSDNEAHGHAGAGWQDPFTGTVNALTFRHALALNTHSSTGWVAVDLQRTCVQFKGTVGWSDTSPTWGEAVGDLQGEIRIFADDVEISTKSEIRFGESHELTADVSGTLRFRLEAGKFAGNHERTTESGYFVVGDPQFLCLF